MATIGQLIYLFETTDPLDIEVTTSEILEISRFLINNLIDDHSVSGSDYFQFCGILDWYKQQGFITNKQKYWLVDKCSQYIDQRQFTDYELM